jgi:maltose-binding protein MalE
MKHTNRFKKVIITAMAAVCALSSVAAIGASAATATNTGTTSQGYRVSSTASFSGKTVTGTGRVVSGGTCTIKVYAKGYYKSSGVNVLSCSISDTVDNSQILTKSTSGSYTLTKAVCDATFNSATKVTATAE